MFDWLFKRFRNIQPRFAPRVRVFFDLDETLFINPQTQECILECEQCDHLTKVQIDLDSYLYFLYLEKTKQAFHDLLATPRVEIGFITSAEYDKSDIISLLEHVYDLPRGALKKCIFINYHDYGSILKGLILKNLSKKGKISSNDHTMLIDNLCCHVESAIECGFNGLQATGWHIELYQANPNSNVEIIKFQPSPLYLEQLKSFVQTKLLDLMQQSAMISTSQAIRPYMST